MPNLFLQKPQKIRLVAMSLKWKFFGVKRSVILCKFAQMFFSPVQRVRNTGHKSHILTEDNSSDIIHYSVRNSLGSMV